jgi:AAA+ superfamily predicted ATPase
LRTALVEPDRAPDGPGAAEALVDPLRSEPRFEWLLDTFGLDDLDAACFVIAAAPELERDIAQALARLRGHPPPGRPDCALMQAILCATMDDRLALQARFTFDAPLFRHRLLLLAENAVRAPSPLHATAVAADPQIMRTLCYGEWLDPRLARYCRLLLPRALDDARDASRGPFPDGVTDVLRAATARRAPLHLLFQGQPGSGRRDAAHGLASRFGAKLLVADLAYAHALGEFAELVTPLLREAWLQGAWLYLEGLETVLETGSLEVQRFLDDLADDGGICIISATQALQLSGRRTLAPLTIEFDSASFAQARRTWRTVLGHSATLADDELDVLASRYRLPPSRIRAAASYAVQLARLRGGPDADPGLAEFVRASRAQGPAGLSGLARKIEPIHRWDDMVLPDDARLQLRELCARTEYAIRVFQDWGFGSRMSLGKGTSALFAGASGTGKTMAAEVIAAELALDLYRIDLATVVSKYIGETEKNLDRVFAAARYANAILLFDEADALFGKRSEVRDAHDRYANLEIAYLLQKMEEYDGLSILATNLKQNLDEAFLRRLTYTVLFPFPAVAEREAIWRKTCPAGLPLAADVDFAALAKSFKLSGGNIRNALLAAAFFAAADHEAVAMRHLVHGVRREVQKAGKAFAELDVVACTPTKETAVGYG